VSGQEQNTKRGGGAFAIDSTHAPMHYLHGYNTGCCVRCQTPQEKWASVACFYPMTLAEAVAETATMLESVCTTTVGLTPREACEQARILRSVERYGR
jgi:hypothetical protein